MKRKMDLNASPTLLTKTWVKPKNIAMNTKVIKNAVKKCLLHLLKRYLQNLLCTYFIVH